jgi:integrase
LDKLSLIYKTLKNGQVSVRERRWIKLDGSRHLLSMPTLKGRNRQAATQMARDWGQDGWAKLEAELIAHKADVRTPHRDFLTKWFDARCKVWALSTVETNTYNFEKHVLTDQAFLKIPLTKLTSRHVKEFLGRIKGTENTRHNVRRLLSPAYAEAVDDDLIVKNPFRLSATYAPKKSQPNIVALTPEQESKLLAHVSDKPFWRAVVLLGLDAAVGPAELLGLKLEDLDEPGSVKIRRNLISVKGKAPFTKAVKTGQGSSRERKCRVSQTTWEAIHNHIATEGTSPDGFLFHNDGLPWRYHAFAKAWARLMRDAGLPSLGYYRLRHTAATALLRDGLDLAAVAFRLGHTKPTTTLAHYVNSGQVEADRAALLAESRFAPKVVPPGVPAIP